MKIESNILISYLVHKLKTLSCNHRYKLKAIGKYKRGDYEKVDTYFFKCKKCNRTKEQKAYYEL